MSKAPSLRRAAEADFEACVEHVDKLRALKEADALAYREAIRDLKLAANGLSARTPDGVGSEMADAVLNELDESDHLTDDELSKALQDPSEEQFMGDDEMFVPQQEAAQSGQIPRDMF